MSVATRSPIDDPSTVFVEELTKRFAAVGCLITAACAPALGGEPLSFSDQVRSWIAVSEYSDGKISVHAADHTEGQGRALTSEEDAARRTVFGYTQPLATLLVEPGEVRLAKPGDRWRALPMFQVEVLLVDPEGTSLLLSGVDEVDATVLNLHLELPNLAPCFDNGGCLGFLDRFQTCSLPCPSAISIEGPSGPAPPEAPRAIPAEVPRNNTCAENELREATTGLCVALDECPAGEWRDVDRPGRTVVYVQPNSQAELGTKASPYASLWRALDSTPRPLTIVLSKGRHVNTVEPDVDVEIVGACTSETRISGEPGQQFTIAATGGTRFELRHVTIESAGETVLSFIEADVVLERVVISGDGTLHALNLDRSSGNIDHVRIRGGEIGAVVFAASNIEARSLLIEGATSTGLAVTGHARFTADDLTVRACGSSGLGLGISVTDGASLDVINSLIEDTNGSGIFATSSTVSLYASTVRGSHTFDGIGGSGVEAVARTRLTGERLLLQDNQQHGLWLHEEGTTATLRDLRVIHGFHSSTARGLLVTTAAQVDATRVEVEVAGESAVEIRNSSATLSDFHILNRSSPAETFHAIGLAALDGAVLSGSRLRVVQGRSAGLWFDQVQATLGDVDVRAIGGGEADDTSLARGSGLRFSRGSEVAVIRTHIEDTRGPSLLAVHADTQVQIEDGDFGPAEGASVLVDAGASLRLARSQSRQSHAGLVVGRHSTLSAESVLILDAEATAIAYGPDSLGSLTQFRIANASTGITVASRGSTVFSEGHIDHVEEGIIVAVDAESVDIKNVVLTGVELSSSSN